MKRIQPLSRYPVYTLSKTIRYYPSSFHYSTAGGSEANTDLGDTQNSTVTSRYGKASGQRVESSTSRSTGQDSVIVHDRPENNPVKTNKEKHGERPTKETQTRTDEKGASTPHSLYADSLGNDVGFGKQNHNLGTGGVPEKGPQLIDTAGVGVFASSVDYPGTPNVHMPSRKKGK